MYNSMYVYACTLSIMEEAAAGGARQKLDIKNSVYTNSMYIHYMYLQILYIILYMYIPAVYRTRMEQLLAERDKYIAGGNSQTSSFQ